MSQEKDDRRKKEKLLQMAFDRAARSKEKLIKLVLANSLNLDKITAEHKRLIEVRDEIEKAMASRAQLG